MPEPHAGAARTWLHRTATEYRSATVAAQFTHWLHLLGASPDLLVRAHAVSQDELRHAEQCYELAQAAGATAAPAPVPESWLSLPRTEGQPLLYDALLAGLFEYALHESVALEVFRTLARFDLHPPARAVVEGIVRDEARHAAFGWDVVDELSAVAGEQALPWMRAALPEMLGRFVSGYARAGAEPTPEAEAWGLPSKPVYERLVRAAVNGPVAVNLAKRGLTVPQGWDA